MDGYDRRGETSTALAQPSPQMKSVCLRHKRAADTCLNPTAADGSRYVGEGYQNIGNLSVTDRIVAGSGAVIGIAT